MLYSATRSRWVLGFFKKKTLDGTIQTNLNKFTSNNLSQELNAKDWEKVTKLVNKIYSDAQIDNLIRG